PVIAEWLLLLPVVPFEKIIELIASLNGLWTSIIASIIGIIGGILLSLIIFEESLEVTITDENVHLKLGEKVNTLDKKDISTIYMENKQLIILGKDSNELYREFFETKPSTVQEAFMNYKYPFEEKDPFEKEYQRWVLGHP